MSRVRAFFLEEATECLRIARDELDREIPDYAVFYRAVRRLRGSAQLARYGSIAREARALESLTRPDGGSEGRPAGFQREAEKGLRVLQDAIEAVRSGAIQPGEEPENTMEGEGLENGVVGMDELEYRGAAALERALELRTPLEDAVVSEAPVGPILEELFDLIRLGKG